MIIKEKTILSDGNLEGEASDNTKLFIRRKPHELVSCLFSLYEE